MSDRILHEKFNCRRRCFETEVFCKTITGLKPNKKTIKQTNTQKTATTTDAYGYICSYFRQHFKS